MASRAVLSSIELVSLLISASTISMYIVHSLITSYMVRTFAQHKAGYNVSHPTRQYAYLQFPNCLHPNSYSYFSAANITCGINLDLFTFQLSCNTIISLTGSVLKLFYSDTCTIQTWRAKGPQVASHFPYLNEGR
jgi:hypothetical protein